MKTIIFKSEYEQRLKQLKIKTKFCRLLNSGRMDNESLDEAVAFCNNQPSWSLFILGAFDFLTLSKEEMRFWTEKSMLHNI